MSPTWQSPCGRVQLYCGDARKFMLDLPPADSLITDPPYGLDGGSGTIGKRGRASRITWPDTVVDVRNIYVPIVRIGLEHTNGVGVITPGTPNAFEYPKPRDIGCIYQPCATGCSSWGRATMQPVLFYGKDPRAGKHLMPVTFTNTKAAEKSEHPTPKPSRVAEWMVHRGSLPGWTILDPFAGSGAFGVAAIHLGRDYIGIDSDPQWFELTVKNCEEALGYEVQRNGVTQKRMFTPSEAT